MYSPPPSDVPLFVPARNSRLPGGGPILAICCLLCILFLIAAVIVLALIPVYVSRSGGSTSSIPTYQYIIGTNTSLSATSYAALAIQIEKALGLPLGSVTVISATQVSGKRKRREFVSTRRVRRAGPSYAYIITGTCRSTSAAVQALVSASGGCNTATSGGTTVAIGSSLASTSNPATACSTPTTTVSTAKIGG